MNFQFQKLGYFSNLIELFALSNELNNLSKDLSEGINLNNKIQIKALLSTF